MDYRKDISSEALTNGDAVVQIADELTRAGVDESRLEAEILLANVIHRNRAQVLAEWQQPISPEQFTEFKRLTGERILRKPLSYITGFREFYGLSLKYFKQASDPPKKNTNNTLYKSKDLN